MVKYHQYHERRRESPSHVSVKIVWLLFLLRSLLLQRMPAVDAQLDQKFLLQCSPLLYHSGVYETTTATATIRFVERVNRIVLHV